MSKLKHALLVGACTASAAIAMSLTPAGAATTQAWGGGSSLIGPYMRQAMDCYGNPEPLIVRGPPVQWQTIQPFNYTGPSPQDCSTKHTNTGITLWYDSASSGVGIANFFSHDPTSDYANGYGDTNPNQGGEQDMPYISYGMSDAGLSQSDVGVYINGNDNNGPNAACSVPEQGVCVVAPSETPNPPTTFANPNKTYGAMVQFPVSVDPVAFAYDPTYKKVGNADGSVTSYHFNIHFAHADGSGGLRLDAATYCQIFNGTFATGGSGPITNWSDSRLKKLNGNISLQDPQDIADNGAWNSSTAPSLQIVGRSDSSGTTSIFTRHLANVCATVAGNQYSDGSTTLPANLIGGNYDGNNVTNEQLGKFTVAKGSGLVAQYVAFRATPAAGQTLTQGHIGYLGADFVLPAVLVNGQNSYGLNSADLKNSSGRFEPATGKTALFAFGSISPPQSDAKGHYDLSSCPGANSRCRAHPYDWAEPISKTSPLANPTALNAYPLVGTTNIVAYTCYKNPKVAKSLSLFAGWYTKSQTVQEVPLGILAANGLSSLPAQWRTAIQESFVTGTDGLNLNIQGTGTGHCVGVTGG
ncbi:MAG TPA: substrate-binding domain-containing protein [Rhizomicrobium sp.]|nr:substrate-binding domain-containing protein [Rhizomicrobium sp.]